MIFKLTLILFFSGCFSKKYFAKRSAASSVFILFFFFLFVLFCSKAEKIFGYYFTRKYTEKCNYSYYSNQFVHNVLCNIIYYLSFESYF